MYGYQPPQQDPEGSWAEIFVMTKVVLGLLAGPMLAIFGVLFLLGFTVWALYTNLLLAIIPIAIGAAGIWYLARRDREAAKDLEEQIFRKRQP